MKQKIIYMLAFICCLGLLSSAKQMDNECIKKCKADKVSKQKPAPVKAKKLASADLRPFHFFLFNI